MSGPCAPAVGMWLHAMGRASGVAERGGLRMLGERLDAIAVRVMQSDPTREEWLLIATELRALLRVSEDSGLESMEKLRAEVSVAERRARDLGAPDPPGTIPLRRRREAPPL